MDSTCPWPLTYGRPSFGIKDLATSEAAMGPLWRDRFFLWPRDPERREGLLVSGDPSSSVKSPPGLIPSENMTYKAHEKKATLKEVLNFSFKTTREQRETLKRIERRSATYSRHAIIHRSFIMLDTKKREGK